MISRRSFIQAGCAIAAATLVPNSVDAWVHGAVVNSNRVTVNMPPNGFMNLVKGWGASPIIGNADANGYPITTPSTQLQGVMAAPLNYFGQYVYKFSGQASVSVGSGLPFIISSGAQYVLSSGNVGGVGDANNGMVIQASNLVTLGSTAPRVVASVGWNIQAISQGASNGAGGFLIRVTTKTGYVNGQNGLTILIAGANANTGANGTWTMSAVDAQNFDLVGSLFSNAQGTAAGTALYSPVQFTLVLQPSFVSSGSFSNFTNLVFCKASDETDVGNGLIYDSVLINQLRYLLNPSGKPIADAWLRFMDVSGVQSSYECDFSQRCPSTYINYAVGRFPLGYLTPSVSAAVTNGGSDAFTCADPSVSVWSGSGYLDNAIVQGIPDVTNSTGFPTLNVGGHGAKPIFGSNLNTLIFNVTAAAASAGLSMVFTFNATWLNGGSNYVFTYTTVSGDTASVSALKANLSAALTADATLSAAKVQVQNSGLVWVSPRTAQAGRLAVTYTSGPAICSMASILPSGITAAAGAGTFVFNYLLDGWIYKSGGLTSSIPLEAIAEACNRVGAHCWWNWGITKGSWVTAVTNFFAPNSGNLNANLKFGTEPWNEVWNSSASPWTQLTTLGAALNIQIGSGAANYSYTGLRCLQYAALSKAAWASGGGVASNHYIMQPGFVADVTTNGNFDTAQLKGTYLNASTNTVYGSYGGLNGVTGSTATASSQNASPNRPVDITTATGCAPYWGSHWWAGQANFNDSRSINGTALQNAPWLQASLDFTNGLTSTAFASLVNQLNGSTARSGGTNVAQNLLDYQTVFTTEEALCAQYDAGRSALGLSPLGMLDYEGGPQWAMGSSGVNGVNSVNSTDINALATQMTNLGWNVSAYTASGNDNKTEAATQVITMAQAWKYDASYKNMIKTSYYAARVATSGTHRETKPAQYGYSASQWCMFPVNYSAGSQYTNYDAIHEFNA